MRNGESFLFVFKKEEENFAWCLDNGARQTKHTHTHTNLATNRFCSHIFTKQKANRSRHTNREIVNSWPIVGMIKANVESNHRSNLNRAIRSKIK